MSSYFILRHRILRLLFTGKEIVKKWEKNLEKKLQQFVFFVNNLEHRPTFLFTNLIFQRIYAILKPQLTTEIDPKLHF